MKTDSNDDTSPYVRAVDDLSTESDAANAMGPNNTDKMYKEKRDSVDNMSRNENILTEVDTTAEMEEVRGGMFGGEGGVNYRTMGRWDTLFAMVTNQLGLGFLSLPSALMTLGVIPGVIAIFGFGWITWYAGLELHQFFCRHQHVVNIVDMVAIVGGRTGEITAGVFLLVQLIMVSASAAITLSIAFNTLSGHGICTVGFIGIACICCCALCLPRSVKFISRSGVPCFLSIFTAGLIVMISLGVSNPSRAPEGWSADIKIVGSPSFRETVNSLMRIIYAFAGNVVYVSYMAEMKNPVRDFPFALRGLLVVSLCIYTTFAVGVYCLAGEHTASPALGSAPLIPAKVAYGIIIPAILTTGLANGHIGTKYVYVQIMRWAGATEDITKNSVKSWGTWIACVIVYWILCFIISNAIPIFDSILSISSATTFAWFTYGLAAIFWFHLNKGSYFDDWRKIALFCSNTALILFSFLLNGVGLWASVTELLDEFANEQSSIHGTFDCGDNSLF